MQKLVNVFTTPGVGGRRCCQWWAVARLTAADRIRPLDRAAVPLLALTPYAAAGAGLAALTLRRPGPLATAAVAGAALAAVVAPRSIPRRQPAAAGPCSGSSP